LQATIMPLTLEQIRDEAMKLSPKERADLADLLWVSVEPSTDIETAWDAEIERRIADFEGGRTQAIPAEQVLRELRAMVEAHEKR
jgi:putative addiction module component (TIGR02574 family)